MKLIFTLNGNTHGVGPLNFRWQTGGNHIATTGSDNSVHIYDRQGELVDELTMPGAVTSIAWDKDGDMLALTNNKSNVITLWDVNTRRTSQLDSSMGVKDSLTFAIWSRTSPVLAVGNSKGNILLYNHRTARKVPVLGKHQRKITCGAFSNNDLLALGGEDSAITVSNLDGDTVYSFACNADPTNIQFAEMKETERTNQGETTISTIVGKRILMLINLNDAENPINLQFQSRYGDVVAYSWYGDGYILLGFEHGYMVCVSTHASEIGQEIFSVQEFKSYLSCVAVSAGLEKAVSAGDNMVKLRELSQLSDVYAMVEVDGEDKGLENVAVSDDGQLLAVSGNSGTLHVYLTRLPVLGDSWQNKIAVLTSLTEITVVNEVEQEPPVSFTTEVEPTFIGVGPVHVAVGMNNRAWFYQLTTHGAELLRDCEYLGSVQTIKLNSLYAAALLDGRVQLHKIEESNSSNEEESRMFPDADKTNFKITSLGLTNEFLILCTDGGHLQYFSLEDWKYVNEYRHTTGVRAVFPEPSGTRLCFFDDKREAHIYSPVNDSLLTVPQNTSSNQLKGVLWENFQVEKNSFVTFDNQTLYIYIYSRDRIEGPLLIQVGASKLPFGHIPLLLCNGQVYCQTQSGRTSSLLLDSYKNEIVLEGKSPSAVAIRIYRQVADVGMVWSLEEISAIEDKNLLAGHLAMFMEQFDVAEKLYLDSSDPVEALEMRRDLLHWDKALQLASRLAPEEIPYISKEYAQQLEFTGDYSNALNNYVQGIVEGKAEAQGHNEICQGGIARMALRMGEIRRGITMALELPNRSVKRECALILESMKQYNEAAVVYEKGQFYDRAAAVCLKAKNWVKVGELLPHVHSPKIHAQYGKAMEAEKKYKPAALAYKNAKDYDNLVRILLDHLNMPEEAVKVVRESKSVEGAKLVAKFFNKIGDHNSAIQFLVLSQCHQEAFRMAEEQQKVEIYAEVIENEATPEQYEQVAEYFERHRKNFLAGKYFYLAGNHRKSLDFLLSNGEDHESLKIAIECVGKAKNADLTRTLTDFLMGEKDGIPKDAKYLFRLYVALQMHREAAKTAIIIAREEQAKGQYRIAHDVLFGMYQELQAQGIRIPAEMANNLMLIHSYLIVKTLIKRGDHQKAARMLMRVANNISRFPSHTVQILTSAVIECSKAGLRNAAFTYAAILMRPEHRKKLDEKYRKKIEAVVRKSEKLNDPEELKTPCPYCETPTSETDLVCNSCQSTLPYCVITGKHIVKDDFSLCPSCHFAGYYTEMKRAADSAEMCPMCSELLVNVVSTDPTAYLTQHSAAQATNTAVGTGADHD